MACSVREGVTGCSLYAFSGCGSVSCGSVSCGSVSCGSVSCGSVSCGSVTLFGCGSTTSFGRGCSPLFSASVCGMAIRTSSSFSITRLAMRSIRASMPSCIICCTNCSKACFVFMIIYNLVSSGAKIVQAECRTPNLFECYAEAQPILCKGSAKLGLQTKKVYNLYTKNVSRAKQPTSNATASAHWHITISHINLHAQTRCTLHFYNINS